MSVHGFDQMFEKSLKTHIMRIDIITIFPEMFEGPFSESIIKRAQDKATY